MKFDVGTILMVLVALVAFELIIKDLLTPLPAA